jgi:hypothetical protein
MGDVVLLNGVTTLPIPVERVLEGAKNLDSVLVLGWTKDGEFYAAASSGSFEESTYLAQQFIHKTHSGDYG